MQADGSVQRRFTDHPPKDGNPTWSSDGGSVLFTSDRVWNEDVYVFAADGTQVRNLTQDLASDFVPDWLPISGP